ncbi:hypothetical protein F2Q70_00022647 [Brassica cretica]|uniref:Uncharacterized protein n=1 Tax=Brassica cretica TaxID=69181 RepID=A0A8S9GK89_BRACR|nr:hypothetical protein F2Q70_00022647 [Brassica cretica]
MSQSFVFKIFFCRQAAANETSGYGRSDNLAQQTSLAGHSPRSGLDSDHNSVYIEKRECSAKERVNQRAVNKSNIHDEFNSSSRVSNTKPNASVPGLRSSSGLPPKLSPRLHNTPSPSDWDISGCPNKPPQFSTSLTHQKRMTSNRSSSPPVIHSMGQLKTTKYIPYSKKDEFNTDSALSESEEYGPPEIKCKDKRKQSDEVDGKAAHNIPKACFPALQSTKAKQLRSARTILGKSESKLGRSPTRKLSGRKTYERQRATATNASPLVQLRHRPRAATPLLLTRINQLYASSPNSIVLSASLEVKLEFEIHLVSWVGLAVFRVDLSSVKFVEVTADLAVERDPPASSLSL